MNSNRRALLAAAVLLARGMAGIPAGVTIREARRLAVPGLDEDRHAVVAVRAQG
jgi:hypothetical protein